MTHSARTCLLLLCLALVVPGLVRAGNGGSTYSRFGLGDIRYGYSAQSLGMGSTGIAVRSLSSVDAVNPASWGSINRTRYAVGALYEGFSAKDGTSSAFLSSVEFSGAMIAIPISPASGIVFAGGITPVSRVNYNAVAPESLGGLGYALRFKGSGGLSAAHAGLSASITSDLHAGIKLQYYFGTIRHAVRQDFTDAGYTTAEVVRATQLHGAGATLGLIYTGLGRALGMPETQSLSVGAFVSSAATLTTNQDDFLTYVAGGLTTLDTATVAEGSDHLPVAFGAGVAYTTDRMILAADVQSQNWDAFTEDGIHPLELRNSMRASAGIEILPKREPGTPYTQRMSYRAGLFYEQTYYQIKNQPINAFGASAGVGFPIYGETRFHFGAEYSMRGTNDYQLQKDNILRISFTVTGGELWFTRPPEE
jgi:hypothetical protein